MKRYDVITLITESDTTHGVFDTVTETTRDVFCEIRSVGRSEVYQALALGINATIVFVLAISDDYQNEKELIYNNVRYRVIRTYVSDDGIELTCEVKENG